jgi:hypothetical protein
VFVSEDFLVASTQIAHGLAMFALDVPVEIWPAEASNIATVVWTIVSK